MQYSTKIINRLKEFYLLERFQVVYYKAQWSTAFDEYYRQAFEKMVLIESNHANYYAQKLQENNIPLPRLTGSLLEMASRILGEAVELTGPYNTCKLGVMLEKKAMEKYKLFILESWQDKELNQQLINFHLDEEYHALWMANYMKYLPDKL